MADDATPLADLVVKIGADFSDFTSTLSEIVGKTEDVGAALSAVGAGITSGLNAPLADLGRVATESVGEIRDGFNQLASSTTEVSARLDVLEGTFKTVFAEIPQSARDAGSAIATELTAPLSDLGTVAAESSAGVKTSFDQILGSTQSLGASLDTLGNSFDGVFNGVQQSTAEVGAAITGLNAPMEALGTTALATTGEIKEGFAQVTDSTAAAGASVDALSGSFTNVFSDTPAEIQKVVDGFQEITAASGTVGDSVVELQGTFSNVFSEVPQETQAVVDGLQEISSASKEVAGDLQNLDDAFQELYKRGFSLNEAVAEIERLGLTATSTATEIKDAFADMGDAAAGVGEKFSNEAEKVSGAFAAIPEEIGKAVNAINNDLGKIPSSAEGASGAIKNGFNQAGESVGKAGEEVSAFGEIFKSSIGGLEEILGKLGIATEGVTEGLYLLNAAGMGLSAMLLAISAIAVGAASDIKSAFNEIIVSTGATGEKLEGLKGVFTEVFANVEENSKEVGNAIADLNVILGLTGEPLAELSKQFLELAHVTGQQAGPALEATAHAFNAWGIAAEDMGPKLDYLFHVFQQTGASVAGLSSSLMQFGPQLRGLGVSFEQGAALIGTLEKAGLPAAAAMMGLRRGMTALLADGIDPANEGFQKLIYYIKSATTEMEGQDRAMKIFGPRAYIQIFEAIKSGNMDLAVMTAAMRTNSAGIVETAATIKTQTDKMVEAWHNVEDAFAPIGRVMKEGLGDLGTLLTPVLDVVTRLAKSFGDLNPTVQKVALGMTALAVTVPIAMAAFSGLAKIAVFTGIAASVTTLQTALLGLPAILSRVGVAAVDAFALWPTVLPSITGLFTKMGEGLVALPALFARIGVSAAAAFADLPAILASVSTSIWAIVTGAFAALGAAIANIGFALSANLVGALTTGEKLLLGFGQAALVAAAAFVGWKLGTWLYENVSALKAFGDAVGELILKIPGVVALIEKLNGLPQIQKQGKELTDNLAKRLSDKGVDTTRPTGMGDQDYQRYLTDKANKFTPDGPANPPGSVTDFPRALGTSQTPTTPHPGVSNEDFAKAEAAKAAAAGMAAAQEAAQKLDQALSQLGAEPPHIAKLADAMDLVTLAFRKGTVGVDQFGVAVGGGIQKAIDAVDKYMAKMPSGAFYDPAMMEKFRSELDTANRLFEKGRIGIDEYDKALRKLQDDYGRETGTGGQIALIRLGIPTLEQLTRQANNAKHDAGIVIDDITRSVGEKWAAAQKEFDAANKLATGGGDTQRTALKLLGITSVKELENTLKAVTAEVMVVWGSAASSIGEKFAAAQDLFKAKENLAQSTDPLSFALKLLGLPDMATLDNAIKKAQAAVDALVKNGIVGLQEGFIANRNLLKAEGDKFRATDLTSMVVSMAGLPPKETIPELTAAVQQASVAVFVATAQGTADFIEMAKLRQNEVTARIKLAVRTDPAELARNLAGIPTIAELEQGLRTAKDELARFLATGVSDVVELARRNAGVLAAQLALNTARNNDATQSLLKAAGFPDIAALQTLLDQKTKALADLVKEKAISLFAAASQAAKNAEEQAKLDAEDPKNADAMIMALLGLQPLAVIDAKIKKDVAAAATIVKDGLGTLAKLIADEKTRFDTNLKAQQTDPTEGALAFIGIPSQKVLDAGVQKIKDAYDVIKAAGNEMSRQGQQAWAEWAQKSIDAGHQVSTETISRLNSISYALKTEAQKMQEFDNQIRNDFQGAFDSLSSMIGKNLIEWGDWGKSIVDIGKQLAESLLTTFVKGFFQPLAEEIKTAAAKFSTDLGKSLGMFDSRGGSNVTQVIDGIPQSVGTRAANQAAGDAGAGTDLGSVASGAGGSGGVLDSVGGVVPIAGLAIAAVNAIINAVQNIKMEKTLSLIEESTRYMKIGLVTQGDSLLSDSHIIRNGIMQIAGAGVGFGEMVNLLEQLTDEKLVPSQIRDYLQNAIGPMIKLITEHLTGNDYGGGGIPDPKPAAVAMASGVGAPISAISGTLAAMAASGMLASGSPGTETTTSATTPTSSYQFLDGDTSLTSSLESTTSGLESTTSGLTEVTSQLSDLSSVIEQAGIYKTGSLLPTPAAPEAFPGTEQGGIYKTGSLLPVPTALAASPGTEQAGMYKFALPTLQTPGTYAPTASNSAPQTNITISNNTFTSRADMDYLLNVVQNRL